MSELRVTNVTGPDGNPTAKFNGVERPEVPPGAVLFFAATTPPPGFLKANGATITRTAYAALFAAIGTQFGAGDGSTTFTLPDMRGEFPRGWDEGRGADPGRAFGSFQADAFQGHKHLQSLGGTLSTVTNSAGAYVIGNQNNSETQDTRTDPAYGAVRQASETRPRNIALLACIKF